MHRSAVLVVMLAAFTALPAAAGVKEKVLFDLRQGDGFYAAGTPIFDANGNLYATALPATARAAGRCIRSSRERGFGLSVARILS